MLLAGGKVSYLHTARLIAHGQVCYGWRSITVFGSECPGENMHPLHTSHAAVYPINADEAPMGSLWFGRGNHHRICETHQGYDQKDCQHASRTRKTTKTQKHKAATHKEIHPKTKPQSPLFQKTTPSPFLRRILFHVL